MGRTSKLGLYKPCNPATDPKVTAMTTFHRTGVTMHYIDDYKSKANQAHTTVFYNTLIAHSAVTNKHFLIPSIITPNTPPLFNKAHAKLHPDADLWMYSIDK